MKRLGPRIELRFRIDIGPRAFARSCTSRFLRIGAGSGARVPASIASGTHLTLPSPFPLEGGSSPSGWGTWGLEPATRSPPVPRHRVATQLADSSAWKTSNTALSSRLPDCHRCGEAFLKPPFVHHAASNGGRAEELCQTSPVAPKTAAGGTDCFRSPPYR